MDMSLSPETPTASTWSLAHVGLPKLPLPETPCERIVEITDATLENVDYSSCTFEPRNAKFKDGIPRPAGPHGCDWRPAHQRGFAGSPGTVVAPNWYVYPRSDY